MCVCGVYVYIYMWKKVKSFSHVWLFVTPWTVTYQAPLSMGFSRQEYWSGLPFPSPGNLSNPGIELMSSCIVGRRFYCLRHQGSQYICTYWLLAIGKNEILPLLTIWMKLQGIMLNEMSDRETQIHKLYLYVESKKQINIKQKVINMRANMWFPEGKK